MFQMLTEIFLLFLLVFVIALGIHVYQKRKLYILSWNLPGPVALPLVGNAFSFICRNEEIYETATAILVKYPSPLRFWFGPKMVVIITDVVQAEKIMSSVKFAKKDDVYKFIEPFDGLSLITASGPKWKKDRRLMAPLFLKRNISQYFPFILSHTKVLKNILEEKVDQPIFNVNPYIHRCVADFVNETVVGVKTNIQKGEMERFVKVIKRLYTLFHSRMTKIWLQNDFLFRFTPYYREYSEGIQYVHGFLRKIFKEVNSKHTIKDTNGFRPIIEHLIDIRKELTDFATDEEMIHHLATLYSASEDTVQSIASFTLVLLGMYPNIQNRVMEEIYNVMGKDKRDIEETDLIKFEYLDMVLKDTLRLFPIAPFIARKLGEEYQMDKWIIPKDSSIIVSIQNIHRDPKHWDRPNDFYPDHFLPQKVLKRHPYAFMPFSAGPRGCIGKAYAYMSLKIMIVTILQHFIIESEGKLQDKKLKMDISIRFKDEFYPVRLRKRE